MAYYSQRGTSREQGYTHLEDETRENREERAAKSPDKIAKAKDRRERRAAKKAVALVELDVRFAEAVAGNPEKIITVVVNLNKKALESCRQSQESMWLDKISVQTDTVICRKDPETIIIRGLPANLIRARAQIQADMTLMALKSAPVPQ